MISSWSYQLLELLPDPPPEPAPIATPAAITNKGKIPVSQSPSVITLPSDKRLSVLIESPFVLDKFVSFQTIFLPLITSASDTKNFLL